MGNSFLGPVRVFEFEGVFKDLDASLSRGALLVLVLCFLISLAIAAAQRFENFHLDVKIYNLLGFALAIGLWPQIMDGIGGLVDVMNGIALRSFGIHEHNLQDLGNLLWKVIQNHQIGDHWFLDLVMRLIAFLLHTARYVLHGLFLVFYFFFKFFGPFVLARGILSEDFSVFKQLLAEVTVLFLWQTTFVFIVGFALKSAEVHL
jgi:hypothetical protein